MADGTPVDIILNPLGVPSRMNVGQVLEAHLGYAARWGWQGFSRGDTAFPSVGAAPIRGTESKTHAGTTPSTMIATPVFDGAHWDEVDQSPSKPTIVEIFKNLNFESENLVEFRKMCQELKNDDFGLSIEDSVVESQQVATPMIKTTGKTVLYNGRTGDEYDNDITVGYMYILKLSHMVDDKIHARSTGPYSMITQQPLGGKAQFGGQRFGEMEVWALEAYGAAYCLQELLTIKSDDVLGRVKVYEAIVKGENIPEPGIPESFKVLMKEMQALCLNVEVLAADGNEIEMKEIDEEIDSAIKGLGIDISRPEKGSDQDDKDRAASRR
jgi:DNA-directed RNA polymerase subunit beta